MRHSDPVGGSRRACSVSLIAAGLGGGQLRILLAGGVPRQAGSAGWRGWRGWSRGRPEGLYPASVPGAQRNIQGHARKEG